MFINRQTKCGIAIQRILVRNKLPTFHDMDEPHAKGRKPDTKTTHSTVLFIGNIQKRPINSYRNQICDCLGQEWNRGWTANQHRVTPWGDGNVLKVMNVLMVAQLH